jgi:hypothetical protein
LNTVFEFEHRGARLLTREEFVRRLALHGGYAGILLAASVGLGVLGFHYLAQQTVIDAFLNACMLLGGMGPVGDIQSDAGKIFASLYALYAGLVFIGVAAIIVAPVLHRVMHTFHVKDSK